MEMYGFPWVAYQLRIWNFRTNWGIDIFWAFDNQDKKHYYFGYHPDPGKRFCRLLYPKRALDSLCSGELNGRRITVPCEPDLIHAAEYGAKWMTPNKEYGINNGYCADQWSPVESSFSYQCVSARQGIRESKKVTANFSSSVNRKQANVTTEMIDLVNNYFSLCQDIKLKQTCIE
jgi:hypothetical protein